MTSDSCDNIQMEIRILQKRKKLYSMTSSYMFRLNCLVIYFELQPGTPGRQGAARIISVNPGPKNQKSRCSGVNILLQMQLELWHHFRIPMIIAMRGLAFESALASRRPLHTTTRPNQHNTRTCDRAGDAGDHVVVVQRAEYGRMSLGSCINRNYYIGSSGCLRDVTSIINGACALKESCEVAVPGFKLVRRSKCPKDLVEYLRVTYSCIQEIFDISMILSPYRSPCLFAIFGS
ncbi:hypothetical protein HELRODRAFT_177213 [Helobdella robusta]|uniref:SUEL-type lectin domain-containing protein n=1 Tax=Helobdella robusta TaxID=6412 RepID=T1FBD1_HELRO|nr:hypothetical protein HELRODRAFT_177213 [Helobdella robusta]ESN98327.1 hypothetical protein HELRODRAFT_177213 [Helobdella robusta]